MGTAGPLALARDVLYNQEGVPFFVLNRCAAVRTTLGGRGKAMARLRRCCAGAL